MRYGDGPFKPSLLLSSIDSSAGTRAARTGLGTTASVPPLFSETRSSTIRNGWSRVSLAV
jgi:hypothetical protein